MDKNNNKTILLVEDEIITATLETRILERNGYTVLSATTGEKAVDMALGTAGIDLILMDIDLGVGMDGPQAAEAILQKKSIPVLFLSSHTEPEIVEKTEKITSYGYVVKNTGETVLMASIGMAFKLFNANRTVEIKSEELTATNEELEATNEELQATMEELIGTNEELEKLLAKNKEAYKQLSEQEYFLQKSQEIARIGSFSREYPTKDLITNIIYASPTFYQIFGIDEKDSLDANFFIALYLDPDKISEFYKQLILEKKKSYYHEYQIKRHNDGEIRWINASGEIIYDDLGNLKKIIGTVQDITERKLAEDALAKSEKKLKTIFDNSTSAIFLIDEETRHIVDANKGIEWIGWTREELIGKSSETVINWSDTVKANEIKELLMRDGKITNYRMDIRKRDGSYVNVLLTADFITIDGKNHILTITTDITRLNETEQKLLQTNQKLEELLVKHNETLEELRKNEYFLTRSQDIAHIGTIVSGIPNSDGINDSWWSSPSINEIYGIDETYPRTRDSGAKLLVDREKVLGYISRQIAEKKKTFQLEYQIRRVNDRELRWLNGMIEIIYNEEKNPVSTITTVQDITDRKNAEEALHKSEYLFRSLFENTPVGIIFSEDRKIVNANKAISDITGYSLNELIGASSQKLYPGDKEYRNAGKKLKETIINHDMGIAEAQLKHKNGTIIDVIIYWSKINPQKNPTAITTIIHDITDQKRYERELKESEEKYRTLINNMQDGVYRSDLEGTILFATPAAARLIGCSSADELIGRKIKEFYYIPENADKEAEILEKQGLFTSYETILKREDNGEPVTVLVNSQVFRDDKGNTAGFEGSFTDITKRKKTENALKQALEEKQILLRELQHRIKNNLSMIMDMIEIETATESSVSPSEKLTGLQRRMYSLAKLYEYLYKSDVVAEVNLKEYLPSIVKSLIDTYITQNKNIQIKEKYSTMITDTKSATAWGLIINELLTNALQYAFPENTGTIHINLSKTKSTVLLKISDNGQGLPAEFDIHKSTGFGLQIVNALADQLGGKVSFKQGKDNTFTVAVPVDNNKNTS